MMEDMEQGLTRSRLNNAAIFYGGTDQRVGLSPQAAGLIVTMTQIGYGLLPRYQRLGVDQKWAG
jgi:hypothetical protein